MLYIIDIRKASTVTHAVGTWKYKTLALSPRAGIYGIGYNNAKQKTAPNQRNKIIFNFIDSLIKVEN